MTGYIKIPHTSYSLDMTDAYSLVAWIKPNSLASYEPIFVRGEGNAHDIEVMITASSLLFAHNRNNGFP